jgi:hypothetical protein
MPDGIGAREAEEKVTANSLSAGPTPTRVTARRAEIGVRHEVTRVTQSVGCDQSETESGAYVKKPAGKAGFLLFPGDIDQVGLDELLHDRNLNPHAEVLVFPHHGGRAGQTDAATFSASVIQAVRPLVVAFSIGRGRHGTPLPEVVAAVRASVPAPRIACTQLSDRCSAAAPKDDPAHLNPVFTRGRERLHCCAGSIVISDRSGAGNVLPEAAAHIAFIAANAPTALCR